MRGQVLLEWLGTLTVLVAPSDTVRVPLCPGLTIVTAVSRPEGDYESIKTLTEATLREIAEVLRRNPDWTLAILGHTDAVASDRYNLDLSARRAVAVKSALGEPYGIAGARLTTAGLGESRPQDRVDTVEGRARNRRVELVRP